jgi:hypothetical protein
VLSNLAKGAVDRRGAAEATTEKNEENKSRIRGE